MEITHDRKKMIGVGAAAGLAIVIAGAILIDNPKSSEDTVAAASVNTTEKKSPIGESTVEMTAAELAAAGIVIEKVSGGNLNSEVIAQATVTAPPEGQAILTARADGAVTRIFKRLGDSVSTGETVALLESRDASTFAAERSTASARAQAARSAYAREKRLFDAKITARQDLEAAQAALAEANAELRRTQAAASATRVTGDGRHIAVTSLIGGRITKVDTQLGAYVLAGSELFRVANPRLIQIEAQVAASDAQRVQPGDAAVIELPGGGTVAAVVRSSSPALNVESRTAAIVLSPAGVPAGLTQGQGLRVRITPRGPNQGTGVALDESAVQSIDGRNVVFVRQGTQFRTKPVTIGARSGGRVEILAGVEPGDSVVTKGAFLLKAQLAQSAGEE